MSLFGFIVVFTVVWWAVFFAALPFGVRQQDRVAPGHDPGAPAQPMLGRKIIVTTAIALVVVGGAAWIDDLGLLDFRALLFGEPP